MLWDMIYNSESRLSNVSVGINGFSPESLRKFKYGFATVPTIKIEKLKPYGVSVLRVKNLTGGNYWGRNTVSDIAASIKEFPSRHFPSMFSEELQITYPTNFSAEVVPIQISLICILKFSQPY